MCICNEIQSHNRSRTHTHTLKRTRSQIKKPLTWCGVRYIPMSLHISVRFFIFLFLFIFWQLLNYYYFFMYKYSSSYICMHEEIQICSVVVLCGFLRGLLMCANVSRSIACLYACTNVLVSFGQSERTKKKNYSADSEY